MAKFNGTDQYLQRLGKLIGVSDSPKFTVSFWFKSDTVPGASQFFSMNVGVELKYMLSGFNSDGTITFSVRTNDGNALYLGVTEDTYDDDSWHHYILSFDGSTQTLVWLIDKEVPSLSFDHWYTTGSIPFSSFDQIAISTVYQAGSNYYSGEMEDFIFKAGEYVDLTDLDNLHMYVSSDGRDASGEHYWQNVGPNPGIKPIGYGPEIFNGYPPDIYFSNSFQNNLGTAGAFVCHGLPWGNSTFRRVYRASAHYDNKERWFDSDLTGFSYTRSRTFIEEREGHPKKGLRMGIDERDANFHQADPVETLSRLLYSDREEDTEEWDR